MRHFSLLAFALLAMALPLSAQLPAKLSVYFESSSAALSPVSKQRLDSLVKSLHNIPQAYVLTINGHTDNSGGDRPNAELSKRRAASVADHFAQKNFQRRQMKLRGFGPQQPRAGNDTEEGKARNRRTDLVIDLAPVDAQQALGIRLSTEKKSFSASQGLEYKTTNGSTVRIPPGALLDKNGKTVSGEVWLNFQEYRDAADFILAGIPMSTMQGGQYYAFNSAGMFTLRVTQNNEELQLAPGKSVEMEYEQVQLLPNAAVFYFDSLAHEWEQQQSGVQSSVNTQQIINARPVCGFIGGRKTCNMDACEGYTFAVRFGAQLVEENVAIDLQAPAKTFAAVMPEYKAPAISYKLVKLRTKKKHTEFVLRSVSGDTSATNGLEDFVWLLDESKNKVKASFWKKSWIDVAVAGEREQGNLELVMRSNTDTVMLPVSVRAAAKKTKKREVGQKFTAARSVFQSSRSEIESRQQESVEKLQEKNKADISFSGTLRDSLFCFYENSRAFMTKADGEDTLDFAGWIDFFNGHADVMKKRYLALYSGKNNARYLRCEKEINEKIAAKIGATTGLTGQDAIAVGSLVRSLTLPDLGIWNCDQLQRLKSPEYVRAEYEDENGAKLSIIRVCLIDQNVNGMLTYAGQNSDLCPAHFPYSPYSSNVLLAFDAANKVYIFPAEKFSEVSAAKPKRYTFRMEAVGKTTKKELSARLKARP